MSHIFVQGLTFFCEALVSILVQSPYLEVFKRCVDMGRHLGTAKFATWFDLGVPDSARLVAGLHLGGFFQPNDSVVQMLLPALSQCLGSVIRLGTLCPGTSRKSLERTSQAVLPISRWQTHPPALGKSSRLAVRHRCSTPI